MTRMTMIKISMMMIKLFTIFKQKIYKISYKILRFKKAKPTFLIFL
jgi:hypothetical protein